MKKTLTLAAIMLFSLPSWSFTPESGFYWNPDEPGTGYSFEIQDNFFFGAFYVYDTGGIPYWYTLSGFMDGNSVVEGEFFISEDGPCLGCNWTPADSFPSTLGDVTITFLTETKATIEYLGQIKSIERHNFFLGDELQKMRGEWQVVYDVSQVSSSIPFFGDVLIFEQTETFDGDYLATGCRSESTVFNRCTSFALNNNDLAASYDSNNEELIAVVRDDADFFLAYYLKTGTDQFDGEAYSYAVGSQPDLGLDGFPVRGFRSASKTFVDTGTGPSKTSSLENKAAQLGLNQFLDQNLLKAVPESSMDSDTKARVLATIQKLEKQLK